MDLDRGVLAHRPGDCDTTCRADALFAGTGFSRTTLNEAEEGEAATAAQLLGLDIVLLTLARGLVLVAWTSV